MSRSSWQAVAQLLRHPECTGAGAIQLLADEDFYDEDGLPFFIAEGGAVLRIVPDAGFRKETLAGTEEERLLIVDDPGGDGWLVPDDLVANWLNRHIDCPDLEDLILAHPLYEYLTKLDEQGRSRGGHRGELLQWAPGIPNLASVYAPEFLPGDEDAPLVNRDREAYAAAVEDLLAELEEVFAPVEIELGVRFSEDGIPFDREPAGAEAA